MFARLLLLTLITGTGAALAQAPDDAAPGRRNQKIERIVTEDRSSRIEEVRVGGQTESVTVQPKNGAPAYELDPAHLSRSRPADHRGGLSNAGGQRYWNVLSF